MANYAISNSTVTAGVAQNNLTSTYQSLLAVAASSGPANPPVTAGLRRGQIYDILVGTNGTPADNSLEWEVARATCASTVTWLGSISSVSSAYALDIADVGFAAFSVIILLSMVISLFVQP